MRFPLRVFLSGTLLLGWLYPMAQTKAAPAAAATGCKPPINRQLYHDYVDREQRNALRADGKPDNFLYVIDDDEVNYLVSQALTVKIDAVQCSIEADTSTKHAAKVTYVRGLENILRQFTEGYKKRSFNASNLPVVIEAYGAAIEKDKKGESIGSIIRKNNYQVSYLLMNSKAFERNPAYGTARFELLLKYAQLYPDRIFSALKDNMDVPFRDSLIKVAAYRDPSSLYNWAASNTRLGTAIRAIDDPLIKTVSRMATSPSGQIYFPFLDNIIAGKQTLEEIDAVKNDDVKYYRLLVKTRMDYAARMRNRDTVRAIYKLTDMLEKRAKEVFVKEINALHEEPDPVRFRVLNQLTPQELYYLIVSSETEIYTSSYTRGVYPYMMQKIANRGDSLMMSVGFDRFKKFIKMAAGFNTLNDFLKSYQNPEQAKLLMTAFVNGLERSNGLEDGVDVADSYTSIAEGNKDLARYILNLTRMNLERNQSEGNQRGTVMYNLLYKLFQSADTSANINLSSEFGIPPVYNVSYASLAPDSARVTMQVFFYGDEDGRTAYSGFLRDFANSAWKRVEDNRQWVAYASTRGKPILVFANKPLDEAAGEDEKAQDALIAYMQSKNIHPTVVIHRGHSYYAPYTIKKIQPEARIVFLGSCGGYHLIHSVLENAPDAHIIASKQIGKMVINQPFIKLLTDKLQGGSNIDWIPFWNEFRRQAGTVEGFDDYIPPHKNLGAIFIKAYRNQMGEAEES